MTASVENAGTHGDARETVWEALRRVIDPEIGINIVDLGLVYGVEVWPNGVVQIEMTMTTRACPLHAHIKAAAERVVRQALPDASGVIVNVVWDPPWSPAMISAAGRAQLGR